LARNTLLITVAWAMNNIIYYGITLNATNLSGNQFVNFFLLAIIEVPSGYFGGVLADKMGRRWTQVLFFLLCAVTCILSAIGSVHEHLKVLVIISIVIAKFAVTLTFLVVYMQGTEIFPTQLRTTGSGFASTMACATSIVAPYMIYLGKLNVSAPYLFLAAMAFVGLISSAFLPETLDQKLPETIEEAVEFGKDEKFWSFCPHSRKFSVKEGTKPKA
jgi:OCT family organic cation transporter-like MFS transporter 4/5